MFSVWHPPDLDSAWKTGLESIEKMPIYHKSRFIKFYNRGHRRPFWIFAIYQKRSTFSVWHPSDSDSAQKTGIETTEKKTIYLTKQGSPLSFPMLPTSCPNVPRMWGRLGHFDHCQNMTNYRITTDDMGLILLPLGRGMITQTNMAYYTFCPFVTSQIFTKE